MASMLEVREKHRWHLSSLLRIKRANEGTLVVALQDEIVSAVALMDQEDVAWVEKLLNVKAID